MDSHRARQSAATRRCRPGLRADPKMLVPRTNSALEPRVGQGCEHVFVLTSQGPASTRFTRAIERRSVLLADCPDAYNLRTSLSRASAITCAYVDSVIAGECPRLPRDLNDAQALVDQQAHEGVARSRVRSHRSPLGRRPHPRSVGRRGVGGSVRLLKGPLLRLPGETVRQQSSRAASQLAHANKKPRLSGAFC